MAKKKLQRDRKRKRIEGDRYILCHFQLILRATVEDSDNSLSELLGRIPEHLSENDGNTLSVCQVGYWVVADDDDPYGVDAIPKDVVTLYEIHHYSDPVENELESEGVA